MNQNPVTLERAFTLAEKAVSLDDGNHIGHFIMSIVLTTKNQMDQAFSEIRRAIALDPNFSWAHFWLGNLLIMNGKPLEGVKTIEKAIRLDPHPPKFYLETMASGRMMLGRFDAAIESLQEALILGPGSATTHRQLAEAYIYADRFADALAASEKAVSLNPDSIWTYLGIGAAYRSKGRYRDAIEMQETALALDANAAWPHSELALSYLSQWEAQANEDPEILDKALEMAGRSVALNENVGWSHQRLCETYLHRKQFDQAVSQAKKAVAIDAGGSALLGHVYNSIGRSGEAIPLAEATSRRNPADTGALFVLGHAYRLTGRLEDAVAIQERLLGPNPGFASWVVHRELVILYSELGREEEAKAEAAELMRHLPHFSVDLWGERVPYKDPAQAERDMAALRKAGLK